MSTTVSLKIKRFDPASDTRPRWEHFEVTCQETDRVLDALLKIRAEQDGTLGFRRSCAHGVCGSDGMMINGANGLACVQLIKDVGHRITLEPLRGLPVIKDLIVDMEPFFAQYTSVMPYLVADETNDPGYRERVQSPDDRQRFDDTTKCILCACCTTSCPVYWGSGDAENGYIGPAAIVQAHRFIFDSRDVAGETRLDILSNKSGVFRCRTAMNCTDACPRGIEVTNAIAEVKRETLRRRG